MPRSNRHLALACAALWVCALARTALAQEEPPRDETAITFPSGPIDADAIAEQVVESLARQLTDRSLPAEKREDIALRLATINSASARAALLRSLTDPGDSVGRLVVAHALAASDPSEEFIDPLFVLLDDGNSRPLLDAAAGALAFYKSSPAVVSRLITIAESGKTEPVRRAAITALGTMSDKRAAKKLTEWTTDPSGAIAFASIDALGNLTGQSFSSAADCRNWWLGVENLDDDEFRQQMLNRRSAMLDQTRHALDSARLELQQQLQSDFNSAARERKPAILEAALNSPEPAVRASAAHLVADLATTQDVPPVVQAMLPQLVSDASVNVRLDAARAIGSLNQRSSFDAIALQLLVEPDPRVKTAFVQAIGRMEEPRSVPLLLRMLDDHSDSVMIAATNAIGELGDHLAANDLTAAKQIARRLNSIFNERFEPGQNQSLREATLKAMVAMRQPDLLATYRALLTASANETARIRQLALQGIGNIGDPRAAPLVVDKLTDDSPEVRIEAVRAIKQISDDFTHAETLYRRLDPSLEADERVRREVWETIRALLPLATRNQLELWPDRFENDPAKRVDVLAALVDLDYRANNQVDLVDHLTALGDTQLQLGKYNDALATFKRALPLADSQNLGSFKQRLTELTLDTYLKMRDYRAAVDFSAKVLQEEGDEYQTIIGPKIKLEAQKLADDSTQLADAKSLIEQALMMNPQLGPQYRGDLKAQLDLVNTQLNERNQADSEPSMKLNVS